MFPAHTNSNALNIAWVLRWNSATSGSPIPMLPIIIPNWLSVDKAIIFFKSGSTIAEAPAITVVIQARAVRV